MLNVLDPRTYEPPLRENSTFLYDKFDANGLSGRHRRGYVYVRRLSYQLLNWFSESHTFITPSGKKLNGWDDLITPYIHRQAQAILQAKLRSSDNGIPGATYPSVKMQMLACLDCFPEIRSHLMDELPELEDFAFGSEKDVLIIRKLPAESMLCE